MTARKPITDKMKWMACLFRVPHPCAECGIWIFPDEDIEWDHVHALAFDGPHEYRNIRPMHATCHTQKTIRDVKANAKVKRLELERAGLPKRKRPKHKWPKRKMRPESKYADVRR